MRRPTAKITMLAMVALFAGVGIASNASAQATVATCTDAWASSPAYGQCGDRSDAPGSRAETMEAAGNTCRITTGCEYWVQGEGDRGGGKYHKQRRNVHYQDWLDRFTRVQNCSGHLKRQC